MGCLTGGSCFRVPELWTLLPSFCIGEALGVGGWVGRWVGWGGGAADIQNNDRRSLLPPQQISEVRDRRLLKERKRKATDEQGIGK